MGTGFWSIDLAIAAILALAFMPMLALLVRGLRRKRSRTPLVALFLVLLAASAPPSSPLLAGAVVGIAMLAALIGHRPVIGGRARDRAATRGGRRPGVALALGVVAASLLLLGGSARLTPGIPPVAAAGVSVTPVLAVGGQHTLVIQDDGTLWSWGSGGFGELGLGRNDASGEFPMRVHAPGPFKAAAAGNQHSLAVATDGTVWAWGDNQLSQLGDGTTTQRTSPVQLTTVSGITTVAAGRYHSLALKGDGTVYSWGYGGALGNGCTSGCQVATPTPVAGLTGVAAIAAGDEFSLALKTDGTVFAWGSPYNGNGVGGGNAPTPVQLAALTGVVSIAAGNDHALAATSSGAVWSWGSDDFGQLGPGGASAAPQVVPGLTGIGKVAAGSLFSLALGTNGDVWSFGQGHSGELGNGTQQSNATPARVVGPGGQGTFGGAVAIAAGENGSRGLALKADGGIWAWGQDFGVWELSGLAPTVCQPSDPNNGIYYTIRCSLAPIPVLNLNARGESYGAVHDCAPSTPWTATAGIGVNVVCGTFQTSAMDLAVPGRGIPLDLTRVYHSADPTDVGFGPGWSFVYGMRVLYETDTTLLVRRADGRRDRFTRTGTETDAYNDTIVVYAGPPGINETLKDCLQCNTSKLTTHDQTVYTFTTLDGRLTSIDDRHVYRTTFKWTDATLTITDRAGRAFVLTYGTGADRGHIVGLAETNILGRTLGYGYNAAGELATVTDVRGNPSTMTYAPNHRLATLVDQELKTVFANTYDAPTGRVTTQRDANTTALGGGPDLTFDYSVAQKTKVNGRRKNTSNIPYSTSYYYDTSSRVTSIDDAKGIKYSLAYDASNNLTCTTDRNTNRTGYSYDTRGNVTHVVDARNTTSACVLKVGGKETDYTYTALNDVATVTDPAGNVTTYSYGGGVDVLSITQPLNRITQFKYSTTNTGDVTKITSPDLFPTYFTYDTYGLAHTVSDPGLSGTAQPTTLNYDAGGRLRSRVDPLGHTTAYDYNAANQVISVQKTPASGVTITTTTAYDKVGRAVTVTDANNHIAHTDYDANGNPTFMTVAQTTAVQAITKYVYDANNNVTTRTDPDNRATTYTYDAVDLVGTIVAPKPTSTTNSTTTYGYDNNGNRTSMVEPNDQGTSRKTAVTYDPLDRPLTVAYPLTASSSAFTVTYTYDDLGNRATMTDRAGTTTYAHNDPRNRLTAVTSPVYGGSQTNTVTYAYDLANPDLSGAKNCRSVTYPTTTGGPATPTVTSCYDQAGRLKKVTDWNGKATAYTYDGGGRLQRMDAPNNTFSTYTFDDADRLTGLANYQAGGTPAVITSHTYVLDGVGNRKQATETSTVAADNGATIFTYDEQDRLKKAQYPEAATTPTTFTYSTGGNRQTRVLGGTTTTYTYDGAGRLQNDGTNAYVHDANGNELQRANDVFHFDGRDQTREGITNARTTTTEYVLDGDGLRVAKGPVGGPNTNYVYDHNAGEPVVLFDGNYYIYGLGLTPIAAVTPAGTYTYFHVDALGSTRALSDGSGTVTKGYDYDAYGAVRGQTMGTVPNDWQYTGAQFDGESKQYNLHARTYDPATGRFTSADPLGYGGGGNLYAYAGNNPASATDRSGLCPWCIPMAIGGAIGAGVGAAVGFGGYALFHDGPWNWGNAGKVTAASALGGAVIGATFGFGSVAAAGVEGSAATVKIATAVGSPAVQEDLSGTVQRSEEIQFELAERVIGQLAEPRLGSLSGRLTATDLNALLRNSQALRVFDGRTGNINVIQHVDGVNLRITVARDAFRIISVGRVRDNSILNTIARGDWVPLP